LIEIEKTRQGGTLTHRKSGKASGKAASRTSPAAPMPQGKGRNAKPKRKAIPAGGRDLSAKTAKKMISSRNASIAAKGNPSKAKRNTTKPRPPSKGGAGKRPNNRPNTSRGNTANKGRR